MALKCLLILLLLTGLCMGTAHSQTASINKSSSSEIGIGPDIPIGKFSSTHWIGAGLEYSYSKHRLGVFDSIQIKPLGIIVIAGGDYYFGKGETVDGFPFKYTAYFYGYVFGGLIYQAGRALDLELSAGPALSIYSGNATGGYGANLTGRFFFRQKFDISPIVMMMKISKADPIWAATLRLGYTF